VRLAKVSASPCEVTRFDGDVARLSEAPYLQLFEDFEMPVLALTSRTMHTLTRDPDQFLGAQRFNGRFS
jgi:hypothetical protein